MSSRACSLLAIALAAVVGTASAQPSQSGYGGPYGERYGEAHAGEYDYADVVRVDPVFDSGHANGSGYGAGGGQRCYTRDDGGYAGSDTYGDGDRSNGYGRQEVYRNDGYDRPDVYRPQGSDGARTMATVIGGVLGAVVGSQVGGGSARYATSAIGSMVGGIAGREVYEANQRNRYPRQGSVTVCDPVPAGQVGSYRTDRGVDAYDVTYEYAGRRYTTRTNYHPGDRIRVRVDVRPE